MARTHGFVVPYAEYVADLPGLVRYLQEKVYIGCTALNSDAQFHSAAACQAHMASRTARIARARIARARITLARITLARHARAKRMPAVCSWQSSARALAFCSGEGAREELRRGAAAASRCPTVQSARVLWDAWRPLTPLNRAR
jgi:hypothetical protein